MSNRIPTEHYTHLTVRREVYATNNSAVRNPYGKSVKLGLKLRVKK